MRWPSIQVGDQPCQSPVSARSRAAPSVRRRGTARISAMVTSAVSSASTPGVFVPGERPVCNVEPRVEQLSEPCLHDIGELTRDDNERSFRSHNVSCQEAIGGEGPLIALICALCLTEGGLRDKTMSI